MLARKRWMALLCGLLVLTLWWGCGKNGEKAGQTGTDSPGQNGTASVAVAVNLGGQTKAMRALLGTVNDVASVTVDVLQGSTLIVRGQPLTLTGGAWSGVLANMPVGPSLTFTGHAYNASNVEIFKGSADKVVSGANDAVSIGMMAIDNGMASVLPRIARISAPAEIINSSAVPVTVSVEGGENETLSYAITAGTGGGSFSAATGTVKLTGATGRIEVTYTAPAQIGKYTHSVKVTNGQGNWVETSFKTNVVYQRVDPSVNVQFAPVVTSIGGKRSGASVTFTAAVVDDGPQGELVYDWSCDFGLSFADNTANPAELQGYGDTASGNIALKVTDKNGAGLSTTVSYAIARKQFPSDILAISDADFYDDFSEGLDNWTLFGDPRPQVVASAFGRTDVFDNMGDPSYNSGAVSKALVGSANGFTIESDVFVDFTNHAGCWADAGIGLTKVANPSFGSTGQNEDYGISLVLDAIGNACWASPAEKQRHAYFVGGIYAEDGGWDSPAYLSVAADQYVNGWHTLKVQVGADRIVKFHVDDNLIWTSAKKLHPSMMTGRNVALGWRSSGSAGKAYHDWVRVRNAGGTEIRATEVFSEDVSSTISAPRNDNDFELSNSFGFNSLMEDAAGRLHFGYINDKAVKYGYLDSGSSTWNITTVGNAAKTGFNTSVAVVDSNNLYLLAGTWDRVSFYTETNDAIIYKISNSVPTNQVAWLTNVKGEANAPRDTSTEALGMILNASNNINLFGVESGWFGYGAQMYGRILDTTGFTLSSEFPVSNLQCSVVDCGRNIFGGAFKRSNGDLQVEISDGEPSAASSAARSVLAHPSNYSSWTDSGTYSLLNGKYTFSATTDVSDNVHSVLVGPWPAGFNTLYYSFNHGIPEQVLKLDADQDFNGNYRIDIFVGSNGDIYLAYYYRTISTNTLSDIFIVKKPNGGAWGTPVKITNEGGTRSRVVMDMRFVRSNDNGRVPSAPYLVYARQSGQRSGNTWVGKQVKIIKLTN